MDGFTTVILWRGQYLNDAKGRLDTLKRQATAFPHIHDVRIEGNPSSWSVVAECRLASTP